MQQNQQLDQSNFDCWKKDPVTIKIFELLKAAREELNLRLTDANIVLGPNAAKDIPLIIGERDAIDLILEIQYSDIQELDNEGKETLWPSSND